jgi:hypothetical protein
MTLVAPLPVFTRPPTCPCGHLAGFRVVFDNGGSMPVCGGDLWLWPLRTKDALGRAVTRVEVIER